MPKHGGDVYRTSADYDFSISVNPFGMPKTAEQAAIEGIRLSGRYPDTEASDLIRAIAAHERLPESDIIVGNGAAELIMAAALAVRPRKSAMTDPGFYEYERAVKAAGSEIIRVPLSEPDGFYVNRLKMLEACREADLVWLCNPNNPTGHLIDGLPELITDLSANPKTVIVVDECFLPFLENEEEVSVKNMLKDHPNLIILRALTKFYGMPGLRIGYLLSKNETLKAKIRALLQPWNVSVPAQMAGAAAFSEKNYEEKTRTLIKEEREYLLRELKEGLAERVYGSDSNFIFFRADANLKADLLKKGVMIRSFEDVDSLGEGYYRIGIRTHEENAELIRRWREIRPNYAICKEKKWQKQS